MKQVEQLVTEKVGSFSIVYHTFIYHHFMATAVFYCGPVVPLTVSEAEPQGSVVRILRSLLTFFCLFHFYFSFLFHSIYLLLLSYLFFLYAFLVMIFPLLLVVLGSGDCAG